MVYRIIVKPEAEQELREALEWYDEQREGLGSELYNEVLEVMERIEINPSIFKRDIRISAYRSQKDLDTESILW